MTKKAWIDEKIHAFRFHIVTVIIQENDFDVYEWTAPEFLEQAAKELLE